MHTSCSGCVAKNSFAAGEVGGDRLAEEIGLTASGATRGVGKGGLTFGCCMEETL